MTHRSTLFVMAAICGLVSTAAFGQAVPTAPTAAAPVGPVPAPAVAPPAAPVAPVVAPPVPPATPAAACVAAPAPLGFELWGDGIDNDCDGTVDEKNTAAQLKAKAEELVTAQCTCAPATVDGKRAVELGVKMLRSGEANGLALADIKFADVDCDAAADIGAYAWIGWAYMDQAGLASYASGARAEAKKANEAVAALDVRTTALETGVADLGSRVEVAEGLVGLLATGLADLHQAEVEAWRHHDEVETSQRDLQLQIDTAQSDSIRALNSRVLSTETELYGDGGSADDSRIDQAEEDIARLDVDHNTVGVGIIGGFQTPETTTDGRELKPASFVGLGVSYSGFGAPFRAAPGFIVGGDLVGAWFVGQQGLGAMPSLMVGYSGEHILFGGLAGGWVETSNTYGRKSGVVSYGADLGLRFGYRVREGLVLEGRFIQSVFGADSVKDGTEQCVYEDAVLTLVTVGAGFSF